MSKARESSYRASYWVPILGSSIKILETLAGAQSELTLHRVSTLAKVGKTSTFRILYTLHKLGYVERDFSTGAYQLGLRILGLGQGAISGKNLAAVARNHLKELRNEVSETANLAVLHEDEIIYVEIFESTNAFRMAAVVGSRVPLHSTALGKSIVAFLPRSRVNKLLKSYKFKRFTLHTLTSRRKFTKDLLSIQERGYSLDEEETELGAFCIGVPILNGAGQAVGALSVSGPKPRIQKQQKQIIAALKRASASISKSLNIDIPENKSDALPE